MSEYFSKPKSLVVNMKVEVDLSNYATKADLRRCKIHFAKKTDLANLKPDVGELDIDKLKGVLRN